MRILLARRLGRYLMRGARIRATVIALLLGSHEGMEHTALAKAVWEDLSK